MLTLTLDQFEFAQGDFGRDININLYNEDGTIFDVTNYTGIIQGLRRNTQVSNDWFFDVSKGMAVKGKGDQVIAGVPIDLDNLTFQWTPTLNAGLPGYLQLRAILTHTPSGVEVSTDLVRTFVEYASPNTIFFGTAAK